MSRAKRLDERWLEASNPKKLLRPLGLQEQGWEWCFQSHSFSWKGRPSGQNCSHGVGGGWAGTHQERQWCIRRQQKRKNLDFSFLSDSSFLLVGPSLSRKHGSLGEAKHGGQPLSDRRKGKEGVWEANAELLV